ncbi:MAG: hypothetical protein JWP04_2970 [Belnapia sp.]|nr:hypothetical protein [Belnapia sp.]
MGAFDTSWLMLGLLFLGCGAVPGLLALAEEKRRRPTSRTASRIAHEAPRTISLDQFYRSVALLDGVRHGG